MAGQGAPVVVRDMAGWLDGDGSSVASIDPPSGSATAIAFALDSKGERLVVAWATDEGRDTGRPRRPLGLAPRRPTADRRSTGRRRRLAPLVDHPEPRITAPSGHEPRIVAPDGASEGATEHRSERT